MIMPETLRQIWTGLRTLLVLTVILGVGYPITTWAVTRVAFDDQRTGSLLTVDGQVRGSRIVGQSFEGPDWFQPRPSANDYDARSSGGSNLGPNNPDLVAEIDQRRADVAARDGVPAADVPADAVTASGSGLDPFISPAYAAIQIDRVARARGLSAQHVQKLVTQHTEGRLFGFLGVPRVNTVLLNQALPAA
jgi:potassium-transporting ATPase KdpC subunit